MKANFYLHIDTIKYDKIEPEKNYINKFSSLIKDLAFIIDQTIEEDEIVISPDVYTAEVFCEKNIYSFADEHLDRDARTFLYNVLGQKQSQEFTVEDIERLSIFSKEEVLCHALIVLNRSKERECTLSNYIQFDRYELVCGIDSWQTVRRQILGNHPGTAKHFMQRAVRYFPNIIFSDNCECKIDTFLSTIPRKIVYYLSCMNDKLIEFWEKHPAKNSINEVCADFAGQTGMDRAGSQQSTPEKSESYTFDFQCDGVLKSMRCGAHFKITHRDDNCEGKNARGEIYQARIYFSIDTENQSIYVGSIGPHV